MSCPVVRPLDASALVRLAQRHRVGVVAEEHSVHGGLGEAVGSLLLTAGGRVGCAALGISDEPIVNGPQLDVLAHYGISAEGIAERAGALLTAETGTLART